MKAIETMYNGLWFRSRLEARWAFVFDLLGIKYEYEKEGYKLKSGLYLPDFWLSDLENWVEIKGQKPTGEECQKMRELCFATHQSGIIISGPIPLNGDDAVMVAFTLTTSDPTAKEVIYDVWEDEPYLLCECPDCGLLGFEFDGRSDRLSCKTKEKCSTHAYNGDKTYTGNSPRISTAYQIARMARFEYGETPTPWTLTFEPSRLLTTAELEARAQEPIPF